ncbi:D-alanyl-D-alanine carboxypeptidase/D-alanyl-D-alanine-endopeptidase [Saccharopolyspora sp. K220]|uniref:D-alanyl-D-alanine carboxypeptidase/D-alanyl-D-alanine endopeptidase n=1 Tax=Saccharopolyspora soli TaxID=2926618 RepID=UPI001F59ED42|nr:D-alanyl-D-alanine carboxypeptidase/D-alanyl-D-alanine-endopeptidase [Saccharopolyspora soli]MCI2421921.1 D-alanyl-D-alanine carboxypeptidase/D-alanyl-D-alanine-endopeptidase [Saccharopolyspora soli]
MPEPQNSGGEVSETKVQASAPDGENPTRTDASSPDGSRSAERDAAAESENTKPTTTPDQPAEDATSADAAAPDGSAQPGDPERSDAAQQPADQSAVAEKAAASVAEPAVTATKRVAGDLGAEPPGESAEGAGETAVASASSQVSGTVELDEPDPEGARASDVDQPAPETAPAEAEDSAPPESSSGDESSQARVDAEQPEDAADARETVRLTAGDRSSTVSSQVSGTVEVDRPSEPQQPTPTDGGASSQAGITSKRVAGSLGEEEPATDAGSDEPAGDQDEQPTEADGDEPAAAVVVEPETESDAEPVDADESPAEADAEPEAAEDTAAEAPVEEESGPAADSGADVQAQPVVESEEEVADQPGSDAAVEAGASAESDPAAAEVAAPERAPVSGEAAERDDRPTDEQERVVEPPPSVVEQTQQFAPITDATPPPSAAEQTQQIRLVEVAEPPRIDETQQIPRIDVAPVDEVRPAKAPEESEVEKTTRIELKDLAELRTSGEPAPQQMRTAPPVAPAEQTQQFARPDFSGPPPRAASAADFAGLTAPHVKPSSGPPQAPMGLAPPVPAASPQDFAGLAPPRAQPQRLAHPAAPQDFAGLVAPQPASPADFAGLTAPRAQPQRIPQSPPEPPETADQPRAERPRRRRTFIAVAVVVVVLLGVGIAFGPALVDVLKQTQIAAPPAPVQLNPAIKPLNRNASLPQQSGIAAALAGPLADPGLGTFSGIVLDAQTGAALWQQNPSQALIPASTGKLLTTSAALLALDHQQRLTTKVVRGSQPGSVVLVGGGDPTLSSLPAGEESVYPGAARLDDLVAQVKAATGGNVTSVQVDTSRYTGPTSAPGWLPQDVAAGFYAPIEPVMLDGGRADPTRDTSPRSSAPAMQTAQELANRLGGAAVSQGRAPANAQVLGQVQSATVQDLVATVLQHSDNVLAEALAREVAIATGNEPSFAGGVKAVREVLQNNGFNLGGTTMADGSGLSLDDRVTPNLLGALLTSATASAGPDGGLPPQAVKLRALLPGLPIGGGSGSLNDRYQGSAGQGWVRAKTGTLDGANSLAGTVVTEDGRLLVFALMSNGTSSAAARPALDKLADALRGCGCR